jgi:multisubunit Na+/H+ antiporter MnhG subunit
VSAALAIAAVAVLAVCVLGVLLVPGAMNRLHYLGPAPIGVLLACAAVLVQKGASTLGIRAVLIALFTLATSPVLSHTVARTLHHRREDDT